MKTADTPRFDIETFRKQAGAKTFERGAAYFADGDVEILTLDPRRVVAEITGSETYRTVLTGRGADWDGECSCPAFDDRGLCKHMVALALAANAAGRAGEAAGAAAVERIRQHLKSRGVDVLVEMIMVLAEQDSALFRKLETAATPPPTDAKALEASLRKAIDKATDAPYYVDYRAAPAWFARVVAVLDKLEALAAGPHAGLIMDLALLAMDRIEEASEDIDDEHGSCRGFIDRAGAIHKAAATAAKPEPVGFARELFRLEMEGWEAFDSASVEYADILGEAGLAEYRRLATEAWQRVTAPQSETDEELDYRCLESILDRFAELDGAVEARIALRARNMSTTYDHLRLAQFCLEQGREAEALRRAEDGLFLHDGDEYPNLDLTYLAADLLSKAGRPDDALARLWRAYEKAPSSALYEKLRAAGGEAMRDRAIAFLRGRLAQPKQHLRSNPAELLIDTLRQERMFEAAWSVARLHNVSVQLKMQLAMVSEATHPQDALQLYLAQVERLVEAAGNGYPEAAGLVARMAQLRSEAEQAAYVLDLKKRYARRRNFMALLN